MPSSSSEPPRELPRPAHTPHDPVEPAIKPGGAALHVVLNKGFDGRGRPSYANASGLNGQESPFCGAVFAA